MWVVSTFLLILCNASKSAKSSDFILIFDWFKRNADWRVQQTVVAREQKYIDRKPSLDDLENAMLWPCCSLFSSKALLYILDTCVIFLRSFHSALFHSWRFISFMALLFHFIALLCLAKSFCSSFSTCKKALYHSASIQIFLSAGQRFIIALSLNFLKCKQVLIFYSGCKSALIFYSSKYETVSNFLFQNMHQLLL